MLSVELEARRQDGETILISARETLDVFEGADVCLMGWLKKARILRELDMQRQEETVARLHRHSNSSNLHNPRIDHQMPIQSLLYNEEIEIDQSRRRSESKCLEAATLRGEETERR